MILNCFGHIIAMPFNSVTKRKAPVFYNPEAMTKHCSANRAKSLSLFFVFVLLSLVTASSVYPGERKKEKDTNSDGKIDEIASFDPQGMLVKLEIDLDADGRMDQIQYYENDVIERMEIDTNHDLEIDTWYFFENGIKKRVEWDSAGLGRVDHVAYFDDQARPQRVEKDTTGSGIFDSIFQYSSGSLVLFQNDPDGDGKYNEIIHYHSDGSPQERHLDQDGDGTLETLYLYEQGAVYLKKEDFNKDGRFETLTWYRNGKPYKQERDTALAGTYDVSVSFDAAGYPEKIERDTNLDGKVDLVLAYQCNQLVATTQDADGDGFGETTTCFEHGQKTVETHDVDKDGRPDIRTYFDDTGQRDRAEIDTTRNGTPDVWEYYVNDQLARIEKDLRESGCITLKAFYKNGEKYKLVLDRDSDGRFETTETFDDPLWSRISALDADGDGNPDHTFYYNAEGSLAKSLENKRESSDHASVTWFYSPAGEAIRAEDDTNGDGKIDTWYYYSKGRITKVEEDSTGDGKPDVWEEYDALEALVKRSRDLDADGEPDVEDSLQ